MPPLIVVIDDEADIRVILRERLEALGFNVLTAASGRQGLRDVVSRILQGESVDGILLALEMSGLDSLEMLQELRDRHPNIPVAVMTAEGHSETLTKALQAGADAYLLKPFDPDVLRQTCLCVFSGLPDSESPGA